MGWEPFTQRLFYRQFFFTEKKLTQGPLYAQKGTRMHKALPSTTLYYKPCTKNLPVYITLYDKACTQYFPVLLCTTKLAQSTPQYYFVLQNLHRALPCTTLYYKVCTKRFPVRLCTTKLAQSSSQYFVLRRLRNVLPMQYYFVLQSLHAVLRTTLYDKTCAKYFLVILGSARHAQSHKVLPSTTSY